MDKDLSGFLSERHPMQERDLRDLPLCIRRAVGDINRILNYASSAHPIMVFGPSGSGKSLAIDQLAAHIGELPSASTAIGRRVLFMRPDSEVLLPGGGGEVKDFVSALNRLNANREISVVCSEISAAKFMVAACPTTSVIMEMNDGRMEKALGDDVDDVLNRFEPVCVSADMEWREAIHEIERANERFAGEYSLRGMSAEAVKSFAQTLIREVYPGRYSNPSPDEHIEVPIGYVIEQIEFAYARALEKPYAHRRITPSKATRLAVEAFQNNPYCVSSAPSPSLLDADDDQQPSRERKEQTGRPIAPKRRRPLGYKDPSLLVRRMKARIVHQDEAIDKVVSAITIDAAGLKAPDKPVASFLFAGPSGVGKTQLAKTLAAEMLDVPTELVRFDCSEFSTRQTASRLFGSPPGYKGFDRGGELTNAVREHPQSVILLDEVEKASPDIWDVFLQVFDEARLTDGRGVTTDFSHCVFIMTGNIGSELAAHPAGFGDRSKIAADMYTKAVREYFKPEFINRLDDICVFNALDETDYRRIIELKIGDIEGVLHNNNGGCTSFAFDSPAIDFILARMRESSQGARAVDGVLKRFVVVPLSRMVVARDIDFSTVDTIRVSYDGESDSLAIHADGTGQGEE